MDDIVQENDDRIDRLTRYQQAGFRKMEALEKPLVHNLGATWFDIIRLLLTQYTKMVLLSFILVIPRGYDCHGKMVASRLESEQTSYYLIMDKLEAATSYIFY